MPREFVDRLMEFSLSRIAFDQPAHEVLRVEVLTDRPVTRIAHRMLFNRHSDAARRSARHQSRNQGGQHLCQSFGRSALPVKSVRILRRLVCILHCGKATIG